MSGGAQQITSQRAVESAERQGKALAMRKQGFSLDEIAKACGYADRSGAYYAIQGRIRQLVIEPAEEVRQLELERLDTIWKKLYRKFLKDTEPDLQLVDRLLSIMDQRAELQGLKHKHRPYDVRPGEEPKESAEIPSDPEERKAEIAKLYKRLHDRWKAQTAKDATATVEVTEVIDEHKGELDGVDKSTE